MFDGYVFEAVRMLHKLGANLNAKDGDGNRPIHAIISEWRQAFDGEEVKRARRQVGWGQVGCGVASRGAAWRGVAWLRCGVVRCGAVWFGDGAASCTLIDNT